VGGDLGLRGRLVEELAQRPGDRRADALDLAQLLDGRRLQPLDRLIAVAADALGRPLRGQRDRPADKGAAQAYGLALVDRRQEIADRALAPALEPRLAIRHQRLVVQTVEVGRRRHQPGVDQLLEPRLGEALDVRAGPRAPLDQPAQALRRTPH
jgi:hypothetical protein